MVYDDLAARLDGADMRERAVTAFPDGSVDVYYTVSDAYGDRIEERAEFGRRIADGEGTSFPVEHESTEPGGQAVNMAIQAAALGEDVSLFGHLDDPVFDDLEFETASMGEPATMSIYSFADDEILFSNDSEDVREWSLADLRAVSDDPHTALMADAICCGNWVSVEGLTDALSDLASLALDGGVFVIDPGQITARTREAVTRLLATLADLERSYDVVLSTNREELAFAAEAVGIEADDAIEALAGVRADAGITATALHAEPEAAIATADTGTSVPNLEADSPTRQTGAGDRFSVGLAAALARDWPPEVALALGNLCASHYVDTARTGSREELLAYLRDRH